MVLSPGRSRFRYGRRHFLALGAVGLSALARPVTAASRPAAKNVLVIFEQGGVSQIDSFDPKPAAAAEHKSPFAPIDTNVPGIQFTELLKQTA